MPQQLGRFPLWQGNREFVPAMQDIYRAASQRAAGLHMGPAEPPDNPAPEREAEQARATTAGKDVETAVARRLADGQK